MRKIPVWVTWSVAVVWIGLGAFTCIGRNKSPDAPQHVNAIPGYAWVRVSWDSVIGASEYYVQRSAGAGLPYSNRQATTDTSLSDLGLTNNEEYYYTVVAKNSSGESAPSAVTTATPGLSNRELCVADPVANGILIYDELSNGDCPPIRAIYRTGGPTGPVGISYDSNSDRLITTDPGSLEFSVGVWSIAPVEGAVEAYSRGASGNVDPVWRLESPSLMLNHPWGLTIDSKRRVGWATNVGADSASTFSVDLVYGGGTTTQIDWGAPGIQLPVAIAYGKSRDEIIICAEVSHDFTEDENLLMGYRPWVTSSTSYDWLISSKIDTDGRFVGVAISESRQAMYVASSTGAVRVFDMSNGPTPVLTREFKVAVGASIVDGIAIDETRNEIFLTARTSAGVYSSTGSVYVVPEDGTGDQNPLRVVAGGGTSMKMPIGIAICSP